MSGYIAISPTPSATLAEYLRLNRKKSTVGLCYLTDSCISFPGRVSNSTVLSELVYSVFNLVVLFNDSIIRKTALLHTFNTAEKLKTCLTVLEYSEVFIEVSAFQTWGSTGRWTVIVLVQVFK